MEIKILAEDVNARGKRAKRGDVIDTDAETAAYLIDNGYAEKYEAEKPVGPAPVKKYRKKKGRIK